MSVCVWKSVLLYLITAVAVMMPAPALAVSCPIAITDFKLQGRSETAVAYGLTFANASGRSVAARVDIGSADGKGSELFLPAVENQQSLETIFAAPNIDLATARVAAYEPDGVGQFLSCSSGVTAMEDWVKSATTVVFAKGTLPVSQRLTPVDPSEPSRAVFVHEVEPTYPPEAVRSGIAGRVDVLVDVTTVGKATNAVVDSSSQFAPLDEAAIEAALASTYRSPTVNGRPAARRYRVPYTFAPGAPGTGVKADTMCHAHIAHGWLIGLDRNSGQNLYEIALGGDRNDITSADITLEKGDASPPTTFEGLTWQKQPDGSYATVLYVLNEGDLVGAMRLESVELRQGSQTLACASYTVATWDHTGGVFDLGSRPTAPPGNSLSSSSKVVRPAAFVHRVWPRYPQDSAQGYVEGSVTLIVHVDAAGKASACEVYRTSGAEALDAEAVKAALASSYGSTGRSATYVSWYLFRPTLTIGAIR